MSSFERTLQRRRSPAGLTATTTTTTRKERFARWILAASTLVLASSCASINYKRLTYDFLRQEDCRRNDINEFCSRTFVFEYDQYEQLRQEYLRIEREKFTASMTAHERLKALHPDF